MRVFNSIQLTAMFAAWPFLIAWLSDKRAEAGWAGIATLVACVAYLASFVAMSVVVHDALGRERSY